jgi:Family of unknown function (DUF6470)
MGLGGIGQIQIHTDIGAVNIRRPQPSVQIETTQAQLDIQSRKPQVSVDRTDYRDAVGALRIADLGDRIHERAAQATFEAIGQIAAEGDQLARIENGTTIADVAQQEMPMDEVSLDLRSVPPPVFSVTPGEVKVGVTPGSVKIHFPETPIQFDVRRATVTVDMEVPGIVNRLA